MCSKISLSVTSTQCWSVNSSGFRSLIFLSGTILTSYIALTRVAPAGISKGPENIEATETRQCWSIFRVSLDTCSENPSCSLQRVPS